MQRGSSSTRFTSTLLNDTLQFNDNIAPSLHFASGPDFLQPILPTEEFLFFTVT